MARSSDETDKTATARVPSVASPPYSGHATAEAERDATLDAILDAVVHIDRTNQITRVNHAAVVLFGYKAESDLVGDSCNKLIPESSRGAHEHGVSEYVRTGSGADTILFRTRKVVALRRNGTEFSAELSVAPILFETEVIGFSATIRDLTRQEQQEEEQGRLRAELKSIAESAQKRELASRLILTESRTKENVVIYVFWLFGLVIIGAIMIVVFYFPDEETAQILFSFLEKMANALLVLLGMVVAHHFSERDRREQMVAPPVADAMTANDDQGR